MYSVEQIDPESAQIRDTFAHYGLALYCIQVLERQLTTLLMTNDMDTGKIRSMAEYDSVLHEYHKKTFGELVRVLRSARVAEEYISRLEGALQSRNWLAHHYWWDRAAKFTQEDGRDEMIEELRGYQKLYELLDEELTLLTHAWLLDRGLDSEKLKVIERDFLERELKRNI